MCAPLKIPRFDGDETREGEEKKKENRKTRLSPRKSRSDEQRACFSLRMRLSDPKAKQAPALLINTTTVSTDVFILLPAAYIFHRCNGSREFRSSRIAFATETIRNPANDSSTRFNQIFHFVIPQHRRPAGCRITFYLFIPRTINAKQRSGSGSNLKAQE